MNNLIRVIKTVFLENSPEVVLKSSLSIGKTKDALSEDNFISYLNQREPHKNSDDEASIIYQNMLELIGSSGKLSDNVTASELLKLPVLFSKDYNVLTCINHQPVCRYNQFLNWRMTTFNLGEDLFTTAFLAEKEKFSPYERQVFDWKPLITHDNEFLQEIMSRGISENHYHLKGSAPHFDLTWISLMNNVLDRDKEISKMKSLGLKLYSQLDMTYISDKKLPIDEKLLIAAAVRLYFYLKFSEISDKSKNNQLEDLRTILINYISALLSNEKSNINFPMFKLEVSRFISVVLAEQTIELKEVESGSTYEKWQRTDYFIKFPTKEESYEHWVKDKRRSFQYSGNRILSGERRFLYLANKYNWNTSLDDLEASWLYVYHLIKIQFRAEFVQINDHVGFNNFSIYQNRKSVFIKRKSIYEEALYNLAINSVLEDQYLNSLECRIGPSMSDKGYSDDIRTIDSYVTNKKFFSSPKQINELMMIPEVDSRYFYTIHFIKENDKYIKDELANPCFDKSLSKLSLYCRNYEVRKKVEIQAKALWNLRLTSSSIAHRILGIDAANSETGCRPEVFAQAFRLLRSKKTLETNYLLGMEVNDRIGVTYHVGEDFLDVADGLRAIAEALRYLELCQGDRLGHALALGINPYEYFSGKNWIIVTRAQDALDNFMWVNAMMRKYGIVAPRTQNHLRKLITDLSSKIYKEKFQELNITPELLYDAWKLRGDSPENYRFFESYHQNLGVTNVDDSIIDITDWDKFSYGYLEPNEIKLRQRQEVCYLNYLYHYDYNVKINGYTTYTMNVDEEYAEVIDKIQFAIQKEVAMKNLSIETNPSSNYVISTFKRYAKHPILRFNNYALNNYQYKDQANLQLFVSINTDDQGVFATYLENEYALMALALEKEKSSDGNPMYTKTQVYEWVDKVRQMGNQQSFINRRM